MASRAQLRGPSALAVLSASYVLRKPIATVIGTPRPLRIAMLPACAAWSAGLATTSLVSALRVGVRVRRAPVLRPYPQLLAHGDDLAAVCTLVSDTHVTAGDRAPTELVVDSTQWPFGPPPTRATLVAGLARVLRHIRRHAPRTVVWCGDEVDTGHPDEWQQWRTVIDSVPELAHRLVPGNHDICFNRPFDEDYSLARRAMRERAYQQHGERLADYPVLDTILSERGPAHVVLLDSCRRRSKHVLSNAIGEFGAVQLGELARVIAPLHGPLLVVTHHHPWRDAQFLDPEAWFNTAIDADQLVAILQTYRRRAVRNHVLACHGHRHAATVGVVGDDIRVLGLPSTTLGDKGAGNVVDGVMRYGVAGLRRDGSWGVVMHEVGAL